MKELALLVIVITTALPLLADQIPTDDILSLGEKINSTRENIREMMNITEVQNTPIINCSSIQPGVYDINDPVVRWCFGINEDGTVDFVRKDSILRYENAVRVMSEVIEYSLNQTIVAENVVRSTPEMFNDYLLNETVNTTLEFGNLSIIIINGSTQ